MPIPKTKANISLRPRWKMLEGKIEFNPAGGHSHDGIDSRRVEVQISGVTSNPPSGKCRVLNLYVDPATEKLIVKWEDTPEP